MRNLLLFTSSFLALSTSAFADTPATFTVTGDVQATTTWDGAKIQHEHAADIQTVQYTLKGASHSSHCVPLLTLIDDAKPNVNPHIKHHDLQFTVQVQGFDGYTVAFSMAELLPAIGNRKVWVALDEDGAPLKEEGGALEIIVPDDVKPARWVHGITVVTVVDGAKLSPAPSK
jgi:hypothetical protein